MELPARTRGHTRALAGEIQPDPDVSAPGVVGTGRRAATGREQVELGELAVKLPLVLG